MLVDTENPPESKSEAPAPAPAHPHLRVRSDLHEEYSSDEIAKKTADFMRVWERIREAHEKDEAVSGTLVKKIKGGVVVDLMGVDAFLPGSQIALRRVPNIDELLGQSFEFKIIKLNKRR